MGYLVTAPAFTPSPYILLQAVTFTPIYTIEVSSSFGRIKKFNGRPSTISLKEFKAIFSSVVYELELKYGGNSPRCSHSNNWLVMCTMRH
jgi:hypothetical protein